MKLSGVQLRAYNESSYLFLLSYLFFHNGFSIEEVDVIQAELPSIYAEQTPAQIVETEKCLLRM